jgi:two-component system cell cycle response regulator DivK
MRKPVVCVVEDYPDNRLLMSALLQRAGMEVVSVDSGAALTPLLVDGFDPVLFLIDLSLPGEDGPSIMQRLRSDPRWAARPMIAVTAHAMAGDRERGLSMGFDDYLTKPIDVATFPTQLAKYLSIQPTS